MTPKVDGRAARSERTRGAIVEAVIGIIRGGEPAPTVVAIAARAGVSERSIFVHFADLEDLHAAVGWEHLRRRLARYRPVDASLPFDERLRRFVDQRCRLLEAITPFRRAALRHEHDSPVLRAQRRRWADLARAEITAVFAAEIGARPDPIRVDLAAALTSWATWDELRVASGRSRAAARSTIVAGLEAVLGTAGSAVGGGSDVATSRR